MLRVPLPTELGPRDADAAGGDDDLVVLLLDDIAADLVGDLLEFVRDVLHRPVGRRMPGDVGDDDVAVVDGVLDIDDVAAFADFGEVYLHTGGAGVGVEIVDVEFDVVLGAVGIAAEEFTHETHTCDSGVWRHRSYVRAVAAACHHRNETGRTAVARIHRGRPI